MGTVDNILKIKGSTTFTITPVTMVYNALEIMVEKNVSALLGWKMKNLPAFLPKEIMPVK